MERTNSENLEIYKLSESLSDSIWEIVCRWSNLAVDTVGKQVIRSADSIGANIAEGSGRGTPVTIEIGTNRLVGSDPVNLTKAAFELLKDDLPRSEARMPPLWDGKTAVRICDALTIH